MRIGKSRSREEDTTEGPFFFGDEDKDEKSSRSC